MAGVEIPLNRPSLVGAELQSLFKASEDMHLAGRRASRADVSSSSSK
jgi:hypothetical protein